MRNFRPISLTHKLSQCELSARGRALIKLERHSECAVDGRGQEGCPVVGIRRDVAQRSSIGENLNDATVGDLGDGGRLRLIIMSGCFELGG